MKTELIVVGLVLSCVCAAPADTFRQKESGEVFYGFRTQKRAGGKVVVYHSEQKKTITIEEDKYTITMDEKGRRDSAVRIPIRKSEALISKVVSDRIAESIIDASNTGPQFILVDIDSPGGRGEYAQSIASAIQKTDNCPVIAYISGGDNAGAFSAAAMIALACDEVFIAPTASIGAVGPMTGYSTNEQFSAYLNLYSSDTLAAYSGFVMGLVKKDQLRLVARALVDKTVSVVEVVDTNGKTDFVQSDNRQPTQTVVRTLAEGALPVVQTAGSTEPAPTLTPAQIVGRVLMLSAEDALRIGLADRSAGSIAEIAIARNVPDIQVIQVSGIEDSIRRFVAARRNIGEGLATIQRLEEYAGTLETQIGTVEEQLRTGTTTREVSRFSPLSRRGQVTLPGGNYNQYYGLDGRTTGVRTTRDRLGRNTTGYDRRRQTGEAERVITDQPTVSLEALRTEQAGVLRNLVSEYRKVINQARRWPGGLPPELPLSSLETNMNSAAALLDSILRMPIQPYTQTQQVPVQPRSRR